MRRIAFWAGVLCLLYVGLGLVVGLLPVDFWSSVLDIFVDRPPKTFYRVVPTSGADYQILAITAIGLVLIVYARFGLKHDKKPGVD